MSNDQAREALHPLRSGDLTDPRLNIAARAVWHAIRDGETPEPLTVAHAAYRHGLVDESDHAVFYPFLVDLSLCTTPAGDALDAATTPAHMARTLTAQAVAT